MSKSLVHKSLELLGYEKDLKQEKKKNKNSKKYRGTLDLIPPKHRVISKRDKTDLSTVLSKSKKLTVHEVKKQLNARQNPAEENVKRLLLLSSSKVDSEIAEKVLSRAKKTYIPKEPEPKEPEATAFTEEDFKKFEEEYVE